MPKPEKGILGVKKKNQMLFFIGSKDNEAWQSDSDDSDYNPRNYDFSDSDAAKKSTVQRKRRLNRSSEIVAKRRRKTETLSRQRSSSKHLNLDHSHASGSSSASTFLVDVDSAGKTDVAKPLGSKRVEALGSKSRSLMLSRTSTTSVRVGDLWGQCLPELVLRQIFLDVVSTEGAVPFLQRASQVCKLWNRVADDTVLWTNMDLSYGYIKKNITTLRSLCEDRFTQVREINFSGWDMALKDEGLKLVIRSCPKLSALNLEGCSVSDTGLVYLVDNCKHLNDIQLSSNKVAGGLKSLKYLLSKRGSDLKSLVISGSPLKSLKAIFALIIDHCHELERLALCSLKNTSEHGMLGLEKFQANCPKLRSLQLVNCAFNAKPASQAERTLSKGFPLLEELNLGMSFSSPQISSTNNLLCRLLKGSERLKVLDLRGRQDMWCDFLHEIPVTDLEKLYFSNCSICKHQGINTFVNKWKHSLIELDLSWNMSWQDSLDDLVKNLSSDSERSRLKLLNLRGTPISCRRVRTVLRGCPRLETLQLESCRGLPRGMKSDYSGKHLQKLRREIDEFVEESRQE